MLPLLEASTATAEILDALPNATDPFALSLNENPFPPLPAVRSALIRSIDVANRYPEFLPERLRRLIAGHIGVCDEQVVLGAGASGVVMQVLHAVTRPGDRIVFSEPTFDGYPIFTQMARLTSVTVPLDERGRHDLEAMAEAAADASVVVLCRPAQSDRHPGTCRGCAAIPAAGAGRHDRAARRGLHRVCRPPAPHRRTGPDPALSECRGVADLLEGLWIGRASYRVRLRVTRTGHEYCGRCNCRSAWASPAWPPWRRPTTLKTSCGNAFCASLVSGITCAGAFGRWVYTPPTGTPTLFTCRPSGDPGERYSATPG